MVKNDKVVGVTNFVVGVGDIGKGSILKATSLNPTMGETKVTFQTTYYGFSPLEDVVEVQWEFGDGTERVITTSLTTTHIFDKR